MKGYHVGDFLVWPHHSLVPGSALSQSPCLVFLETNLLLLYVAICFGIRLIISFIVGWRKNPAHKLSHPNEPVKSDDCPGNTHEKRTACEDGSSTRASLEMALVLSVGRTFLANAEARNKDSIS